MALSCSDKQHLTSEVLGLTANLDRLVASGSFSTNSVYLRDVRFTPERDQMLRGSKMTLCAISDQSAPQQK